MKIRTRVQFSGVPIGTIGEAEKDDRNPELYKITWELTHDGTGRKREKPLVDWFNQEEFDNFLEII